MKQKAPLRSGRPASACGPLAVTLCALALLVGCASDIHSAMADDRLATPGAIVWDEEALAHDEQWYATPIAQSLAETVIEHQSAEGGWPKNTNLFASPTAQDAETANNLRNTFDNGATILPLRFLARMAFATRDPRYIASFNRGLDYTLEAQYPNGGWPQFYPLRQGYYTHVTLNDDAMARIMTFLSEVASGAAAYNFVDAPRRSRATDSVTRGVDLILRLQIRENGQLTGWSAQYDAQTLSPAWARRYEPPSLSGGETVGLLRYLISIQTPPREVIDAVEGGVAWLRNSAIRGYRVEDFVNNSGQRDRRLVADANAALLWARFYELGTNRPIFVGRDSVVRYTFDEIEPERRRGYNYYGTWAARLLEVEYPAWRSRNGLTRE